MEANASKFGCAMAAGVCEAAMPQPLRAEYAQALAAMSEARLARDKAIRERDEVVEERDFMLTVLRELGLALIERRALDLRLTADCVEDRWVYASLTDALAVATRMRGLIAMVDDGGGALAAIEAAIAAAQLRA